jgi:hypothetical protein
MYGRMCSTLAGIIAALLLACVAAVLAMIVQRRRHQKSLLSERQRAHSYGPSATMLRSLDVTRRGAHCAHISGTSVTQSCEPSSVSESTTAPAWSKQARFHLYNTFPKRCHQSLGTCLDRDAGSSCVLALPALLLLYAVLHCTLL